MKKQQQLLFAGLISLLFVPGGFSSAKVPVLNPIKKHVPIKPKAKTPVLYPDNSKLNVNKLVSKDSIIKRIKKGTLKSIDLLSYDQFITASKSGYRNVQISPKRWVYSVVVEVTNLIIRPGRFDKATVKTLIDAQTGENLSVDVVGKDEDFHPDHPGLQLKDLPPEMQREILMKQLLAKLRSSQNRK